MAVGFSNVAAGARRRSTSLSVATAPSASSVRTKNAAQRLKAFAPGPQRRAWAMCRPTSCARRCRWTRRPRSWRNSWRAAPTSMPSSQHDLLAAGVLFECHRRGIAVPAQLAIMGFGDLPIARAASPQLSTVRVRRTEMGERAGQMLLARLAGHEPGARRVDIRFEVVARQST
ncbi:MAG: substrate-binding domain-containing protein [Rubrivivax sp.]